MRNKLQPNQSETQQSVSSKNDLLEPIKEESENDDEIKEIDRKYSFHETDYSQEDASKDVEEVKEG